jgi:hypothetical protein
MPRTWQRSEENSERTRQSADATLRCHHWSAGSPKPFGSFSSLFVPQIKQCSVSGTWHYADWQRPMTTSLRASMTDPTIWSPRVIVLPIAFDPASPRLPAQWSATVGVFNSGVKMGYHIGCFMGCRKGVRILVKKLIT